MLLVLGLLTTHQLLAWGRGERELGLSLGMFCRLLILFSFCCRFVSQKKVGFCFVLFFAFMCITWITSDAKKKTEKKKGLRKLAFYLQKVNATMHFSDSH